MTQILLGTIAANKLNLNGDQGNLLALKRYLEAAGLQVRVVPVATTDEALACHFLMLGHGSLAAMASLGDQLASLDWHSILSTVPGLSIGSGSEWLAEHTSTEGGFSRVDRVSEFRVATLGPVLALGYRNSDTTLPDLTMNGTFIQSMLHGPLLAKNPVLLARAARAAVTRADIEFPNASDSLRAWTKNLNRICSAIWQLEAPGEKYPELL